jgi:hypothetical protein
MKHAVAVSTPCMYFEDTHMVFMVRLTVLLGGRDEQGRRQTWCCLTEGGLLTAVAHIPYQVWPIYHIKQQQLSMIALWCSTFLFFCAAFCGAVRCCTALVWCPSVLVTAQPVLGVAAVDNMVCRGLVTQVWKRLLCRFVVPRSHNATHTASAVSLGLLLMW